MWLVQTSQQRSGRRETRQKVPAENLRDTAALAEVPDDASTQVEQEGAEGRGGLTQGGI